MESGRQKKPTFPVTSFKLRKCLAWEDFLGETSARTEASRVMWGKTEAVAQFLGLDHESTSLRNWQNPQQSLICFHSLGDVVPKGH